MNPDNRPDDVLDYDADEKQLIVTDHLGPNEYGASLVVAFNVVPWFGLWAEAAWAQRQTATPPQADRGLREAIKALPEMVGEPNVGWSLVRRTDVLALLRDTPPAGLDVETLGEAIFRVGTGYRQRETATIPARIANSQDGARASGEFASAIAAEYARLRDTSPGETKG